MAISQLGIYLRKKRQGGYTLGELLVTMSVVGILSSVAVPGMQNVVLNNRRVTTVNDFVYTMQLARSESIARNQRVTVCASRNGSVCTAKEYWGEGWIMFNDLDLNGLPGGSGETILRRVEAGGSLDILPDQFLNRYTYRPNGRVMANTLARQSGEFVFCDKRGANYARVVIVATSGRPRLSEHRADGSVPSCEAG